MWPGGWALIHRGIVGVAHAGAGLGLERFRYRLEGGQSQKLVGGGELELATSGLQVLEEKRQVKDESDQEVLRLRLHKAEAPSLASANLEQPREPVLRALPVLQILPELLGLLVLPGLLQKSLLGLQADGPAAGLVLREQALGPP